MFQLFGRALFFANAKIHPQKKVGFRAVAFFRRRKTYRKKRAPTMHFTLTQDRAKN
ncbi:hypothetical protein [Kaistella jeonii]|uniref:hypothetical protein n=1 Tax=Kaistella jeonii TaxID=266749 RepID=UPI000AF78DA7|nr:hypothetical protein [Kaistella jeonii]